MENKIADYLQHVIIICRKAIIYVALFSFVINILMFTVPLYMLQLYDRVLASQSYETLIYLTVIALFALSILAFLDVVRSRIMVQVSLWLEKELSPNAISLSADQILGGRSYGAQVLRDINQLRQFISGPGILSLFDSPWVPIYLLVIFLLHPLLGVISLVGAVLLLILAIVNEYLTRKPLILANQQVLKIEKHLDSTMRNAEVIQAMGMMTNIIKVWREHSDPVLGLQKVASNRSGIIVAISKFLRLSLQVLILGGGAVLVIKHQLTPGAMIAASILMSRALAPVEQAISIWKQWISSRQTYRRLKEYFRTSVIRTAGIKLPYPKGKIEIENVVYYPPGEKHSIISNISFQIQPGETVALIGPSGAGKTTLTRLIVGVWKPNHGQIRLDGADVYSWDRADFGGYVGYLPQDVELFAGTIKQNIARMGVANDDYVIKAAKLAGVHELILKFPKGYDTEIEVGRFNLSGGQKQRVGLARALYGDPRLVVLDEPNSNLDREGENALIEAIKQLHDAGTTVIVVTLHPVLIRNTDRIVILKEGRIQKAGPTEKVLNYLSEQAQKITKFSPKRTES